MRRTLLGSMLSLLAVVMAVAFGGHVDAQSVAQGYGASSQLSPGIIVQLDTANANNVEPLTSGNASKMFGVVIDANASPVSLSDGSTGTQVYVVTTGTYDVLVSNQNGVIRAGDYITISSLDGTGMKADTSSPLVLGKAADSFDGKTNVLNSTTLKNSNGGQVSIAIGRIPVEIAIGRNPLLESSLPNLPGFLSRATENVANKPVSTSRAYLGLAILLVSAVIAGSLLYGGVRSGFVAIGRNPLAKKSIVRNLVQVTFTSLIIFIIGLFAVYLLLKL
jgi:hypothetical protein